MKLLGIDIGTTNCKVGLYNGDTLISKIATKPTKNHTDEGGNIYYNPSDLMDSVSMAIKDATEGNMETISSIGITSMAETGILLDKQSGKEKSEFIPWFSKCATNEAEFVSKEEDGLERFVKTGLLSNFKQGLPKLIWIENQNIGITKNAIWLSVSDYIAYKLTGKFATDYTLAARTYAFDINEKRWDEDWLRNFGFSSELFPETMPTGTVIGTVNTAEFEPLGIKKGTPVTIGGHDHLCASLGVGATKQGQIFNSVGTAETIIGNSSAYTLGRKEYDSGFSFGNHVLPDKFFWMGNIPSSGGSIEWYRRNILAETKNYKEMERYLSLNEGHPSGIYYLPYLLGSGSPAPDSATKGAFIGLQNAHHTSDLVKAVYEGVTFEFLSICKTSQDVLGEKLQDIITVGGGTRNKSWMKLKANVSNHPIIISETDEATLLGAALLSGLATGYYKSVEEVNRLTESNRDLVMEPNEEIFKRYQPYYETYKEIQKPLRDFYHKYK